MRVLPSIQFMFFFCLFIGVLLGYLLCRFSGRGIFVPCALGAVLPDLVDKPLGYLVPGTIVGSGGRIYMHGLFFLLLLFFVGFLIMYRTAVLIWWRWESGSSRTRFLI